MDAASGGECRTGTPSLAAVKALVAEDMSRVDRTINANLASSVSLIPELARHVTDAGGKRIRPLITVLGARAAGYEGDRHIGLAAVIEFIHTATLLHDDVVDNSLERRGLKSANAIWGNAASVLVGDFLFSQAFRVMVSDGSLPVLRLLSNAAAVIAQGEVLQLATTGKTTTTEDEYLEVVRAKTAQLFAAAAAVGGHLVDHDPHVLAGLDRYGDQVGTAFQLTDDALDYLGESRVTGKPTGGDFREGRLTLPVILAYAQGNRRERDFWDRTLGKGQQSADDFGEACRIIRGRGTIAQTHQRAMACSDNAVAALGVLPPGPCRDALADLAHLACSRKQ